MGIGAVGAFTWDDLQHAPDNNLRRELVDEQLPVMPSPRIRHQVAVLSLARHLSSACRGDLRVILSPCDWKVSATTVFVPDLMVVRRDEIDLDGPFTGTPLLVVEVRTPPTAAIGRTLKGGQYAPRWAASYWQVNPGGSGADHIPRLTMLKLADGTYTEVATVRGDDPYRAEVPFPATMIPGQLVREPRDSPLPDE
jgi:Uma2 family endonuclease